jgi:hypothetical protein
MASIEWYNDVRPALVRMQKVGGHAARGAAGGAAAVLLIGVIGFGWNMSTSGGLVRALGGVTTEQLADEFAAHPGRAGPAGPPGPAGPQGPEGPAGPSGDAAAPAAPPVPVVRLTAKANFSFDKSGPIEHSETYPLCALAKAALRRDAKSDGGCQLKHGARNGGQWEVAVHGATCAVTCYTLSTGN